MKERPTYQEWMKRIDNCLGYLFGLSVNDLADFPSRDLFDSGAEVAEGVVAVLDGDFIGRQLLAELPDDWSEVTK